MRGVLIVMLCLIVEDKMREVFDHIRTLRAEDCDVFVMIKSDTYFVGSLCRN